MSASFKILIITWSANGIRFCETLSEKEAQDNRSNIVKRLKYSQPCLIADFVPELGKRITEQKPSLVVFGFTDEAKSGTYLHSDLLPKSMQNFEYTYITRDKLENDGAMRISVFAQKDIVQVVNLSTQQLARTAKLSQNVVAPLGSALAVYIALPTYGSIAFVLASLKDDVNSITASIKNGDPMIRKDLNASRDVTLNYIIRSTVLQSPIKPDHVFLFGKLNYRLNSFTREGQRLDGNAVQIEFTNAPRPETFNKYIQYDELREAIKSDRVYNYLQEGVNNAGPVFRPTCIKRVGREVNCANNCYVTGQGAEILPAWCTRILFFDPILKKNVQVKTRIKCLTYTDFDYYKTMQSSGDAGVYGLYEFAV